jgi:hypothetical protein
MESFMCRHQDMMLDSESGIKISACRNQNCPRCHAPVSELICGDCSFQEEPHPDAHQTFKTLGEIFDTTGLETRPPGMRLKILETYCLKCVHCDEDTKICGACDCTGRAPIDEYIRFTKFNCPLELW